MSKKHSRTTCSGMDWNQMNGLLYCLKEDKKWLPYLFIGTGCYLGLRAGDILKLRWCDIADTDELHIIEQKTGKQRCLTINPTLKEIFTAVEKELKRQKQFNDDAYLFCNRHGGSLTIQYINRVLKQVFKFYNVKVQNPSTHTFRKTFGKRVWDMDDRSERSLIYLSQIFNHSSLNVTRRYVGILQEDIRNIYMNL